MDQKELTVIENHLQNIHKCLLKLVSIESSDRSKSDIKVSEILKPANVKFDEEHHKFLSTAQTVITSGTSTAPDPDDIAGNPAGSTGYDKISLYQILGRKPSRINVINDGTTPLYALISHDGKSISSNESLINTGEVRSFYDVYEIRLRSTTAGNLTLRTGGIYRLTEFDITPSGSGGSISSLNRPAFITQSAQNIAVAIPATQLNDTTIPNGFALVVRADPNNNADVFLANSSANTNVATTRITLSAGDAVKLFITNANLVFVLSTIANQNVDYIVEQ